MNSDADLINPHSLSHGKYQLTKTRTTTTMGAREAMTTTQGCKRLGRQMYNHNIRQGCGNANTGENTGGKPAVQGTKRDDASYTRIVVPKRRRAPDDQDRGITASESIRQCNIRLMTIPPTGG